MSDLLIELFSEEIPARMQRKAAGDLRKLVTGALVDAGLTYEGAKEYWTPRRLALDIRGLTPRSADIREEKKGPRVGAPEQAVMGFLRSAGLDSLDQAQIVADPKKGEFYVAVIEKPGRDARQIIAEALPAIIRDFPWPKSMRWGEASREAGSLRWVRPLKSILCLYGSDTEEPEIIPFEVSGIASGNVTFGHRFLAPQAIEVKRFDDYVARLEAAKVVLDAERRKSIIAADAANLAFAQGFELVEDEGLLEEVANLVEWPVVVMGSFEEEFLDLPDEVTRLTIRENQKCFVLRNPGGGAEEVPGADAARPRSGGEAARVSASKLTNRFMLVSNIEPVDGGREIARGNGKVVRARLSDAKFFWQSDLQVAKSADGFDKWIANLDSVTFHAKLGSQGERVQRIVALARELAPAIARSWNERPDAEEASGAHAPRPRSGGEAARVSADELAEQAARAAYLAKADLQSAMVFEFPELQGRMGRLYAEAAGEAPEVALAIEEHYSPLGPSDSVPTSPVSVAVALADKLDTLVGFWAIDEKPTGSKDPYALRRAALGVIRLVLDNNLPAKLLLWIKLAQVEYQKADVRRAVNRPFEEIELLYEDIVDGEPQLVPFNFPHMVDDAYSWVLESIYDTNMFLSGFQINMISGFESRRTQPWGVPNPSEHAQAAELSERVGVAGLSQFLAGDLLSFFHDRLKVFLRDSGARHDLIDAVITPDSDDLLLIVTKVRALQKLVESEDGANLLAGYKRAANILAAEEKKGTAIAGSVSPGLMEGPEEKALLAAVESAEATARTAVEAEDFEGAMAALAALRGPLDAFFDKVLVNADDPAVRANRLALLARIRAATALVADFSKISG